MTEPRVLMIAGRETGPVLWRVFSPCKELTRRGYVAVWRNAEDMEGVFAYLAQGLFNTVVLPRLSWSDQNRARRLIDSFHKAGCTVVWETDDDTFSPSITLRQQLTLQPEKSLVELELERQWRIQSLQLCDGVTVSTPRIKTAVQQVYDGPIEVVPNAIDTDFWNTERRRWRQQRGRTIPYLTVGWSGGGRYADDLASVAEAWSRLAKRFPDLHFVVQGTGIKNLIDSVPEDRLHRIPWAQIDWSVAPDGTVLPPYLWGMFEVDIACCSVSPRLFNTAKSVIKWYEATYAGAACVVSPTLYGPAVTDGENALVAETPDEWTEALARLVNDAELRRRLRRNARRHIAEHHSMRTQWWKWLAAYQRILEHVGSKPRILLPA